MTDLPTSAKEERTRAKPPSARTGDYNNSKKIKKINNNINNNDNYNNMNK